jgi:transcriptional regulator PpsR
MQNTQPLQPDVKVVLDRDGIVLQAKVANDISGECVDLWLGRPWSETVEGFDHPRFTALADSAFEHGVSPFLNLSQRFPSGLVIPVEYLAVPHGEDGLVAVGRDVRVVAQLQSRLAAAQQSMERGYWQLRDVEHRYRMLFEATNEAMTVIGSEAFEIVEANPAAIATLGLANRQDPHDITGQSLLDCIAPGDRNLVEVTLQRARERGKAPRVLVHLAHSRITWLMRVSVLDIDQARHLLVHLTASAEASRNSVAADHAQVSPDALLEFAPDAVAAIDDAGMLVSANSRFFRMTEEDTAATVIGSPLDNWLKPPGGDTRMLLDALRDHGEVRLFPSSVHGSRGRVASVEVSAQRFGASADGLSSVYIRDVSRRLDTAERNAAFGQLLDSMTEQLGKSGLKQLVGATVGLVERHFIEAALATTDGNRTAAAKMLGVSRQSLYVKVARYGIDAQDEK